MKVVIACDNLDDRERTRDAAEGLGLDAVAVRTADLVATVNVARPEMVIIGIGLDESAALNAIHFVGDIPTYLLLSDNVNSLPVMVRAGASGYLRSQQLIDDLATAIEEVRHAAPMQVAYGKIIGVSGGTAGVGVTTVATQLAFALAQSHAGQVALVQLDATTPDLAQILGLNPSCPMAELVAGWTKLDPTLLSRRMIDHPAGVSVLADAPGGESLQWTPGSLRQLLATLRTRFDFVVVDFGHAIDPARLEALKFADGVAVVVRLDAPALAMSRDLVSRLIDGGVYRDRMLGVVNRAGQAGQLPRTDACVALEIAVADPLPDDPARLNQALNTRRPLVTAAATAPITAGFARLARRWATPRICSRRVVAGAG